MMLNFYFANKCERDIDTKIVARISRISGFIKYREIYVIFRDRFI